MFRVGRLLIDVYAVIPRLNTPAECAQHCLSSTACRSFDHSILEANCVLHSSIEGPVMTSDNIENIYQTPSLQTASDYRHYERLGEA